MGLVVGLVWLLMHASIKVYLNIKMSSSFAMDYS